MKACPCLGQISMFPPIAENASISDHGEVFVGDVPDESTDKSAYAHRLIADLASFGIIFEREADGLAVIIGNPIFGENGALGVPADIANAESWINQGGADKSPPGHFPEGIEHGGKLGILLQVQEGFRESPFAFPVCLLHHGGYMVLPAFLQTSVMHEEFGIGGDPALAIKAQSAARDDKVHVHMPFQVGPKRVKDGDDTYAHPFNVAGPLLDRFEGGLHHQIQTLSSIDENEHS